MPTALNDDQSVWAFDLGMVNAYLVDDGTVTLIDAGTPGAADDLESGLEAAGYSTDEIDRVLLTHFDLDHVGGLAPLGIEAPAYMMDPDASMLEGSDRLPFTSKKGLLHRVTGVMLTRPNVAIERVQDGQQIGGFTAHHTPGHTPGHVLYHHPELEVALLGDLVAEDDGTLGTPPWPLTHDNGQNRRSIRELAERDLSFEIACMGHGDPLTSGGDDALAVLANR